MMGIVGVNDLLYNNNSSLIKTSFSQEKITILQVNL